MSEKLLEPPRHEPTDVGGNLAWIGSLVLVAAVLIMASIVLLLFPRALTERGLPSPVSQYPSPRLQTDPASEMVRFYSSEMQRLNSSGWIDKQKGVVHIPITEAMRIISEENIPGWPGAPENPPGGQAEILTPAAPTEKPNEAKQASPSVASAPPSISARNCSATPARHGKCVRTKARGRAPAARHLSRRHRASGAAR